MESLTLPATLDSLEAIGKFVMSVAASAAIDRKRAYQLRLAVDEVITNIIVHGYQEAGLDGAVRLQATVDSRALTILVEDTAIAFDPREVPEPTGFDDRLEDRPIGGLGVYLAIHGVDEFRYEHADGCNRNIFVVHRAPVTLESA